MAFHEVLSADLRHVRLAAAALSLCLLTLGNLSAAAAEPDNLEALRERALDLVNASRGEQDLAPLDPTESLNQAAQAHAEDMLERDYFSHEAPDGETVRDRYLAQGGNRWELVQENIGTCRGCEPDLERMEGLHEGWMESPGHRRNILREGLKGFGFGVAAADSQIYAVQTFAGPGAPREESAVGETPIPPEERLDRLLRAVNEAREAEGAPPVEGSDALSKAAEALLPEDGAQPATPEGGLYQALPEGARDAWRALAVIAGSCGGCGTDPTAADVAFFGDRWLENPQYADALLRGDATHLGFAMRADGDGRKVALAVAGQHR